MPPVTMTVNLSSRQFQSGDLLERVSRMLTETGMPSGGLEIEITEEAAMANIDYSIDRLQALTGLGVRVSIDNFGTGYTSLFQLRRLPVGKLKLDRSFVRDIPGHADGRALVAAMLMIAHSMNLKVAAAGVEGDQQLSFLTEIGCDEAQGRFFSDPLPADKFRALLMTRDKLAA